MSDACPVGCHAHCTGCGRHFGGVRAFDVHQSDLDPVRCHDPSARKRGNRPLERRGDIWVLGGLDKAAFAGAASEAS